MRAHLRLRKLTQAEFCRRQRPLMKRLAAAISAGYTAPTHLSAWMNGLYQSRPEKVCVNLNKRRMPLVCDDDVSLDMTTR